MKPLSSKMKAYLAPQEVKERGIYPFFSALGSGQDTEVQYQGERVLMFGSNNYLGLSTHPLTKEAAIEAIRRYGTGCAGSRFLNGTIDLHEELERALAEFTGKEEALVFSTGFQANLGAVSALTGRHEYIIMDDADHASIIDGGRLSFSKVVKYRHNDVKELESVLSVLPIEKSKLIIVDGVFSMEGDLADLPGIVRAAEKYGASIMVDEAHSIGVFGHRGAGAASHFGLSDKVDVIMGTFSKSLASVGGFIAADSATINYLKHHSRTLIFSASISPPNAASALAALEIIKSEPERVEKLWANTRHAMEGLRNAGFDIGRTESPIIPIYIRDNAKTFMLRRMLLDDNVFVNAIVSPAVPEGSSLIRFSLMATHTTDQIDTAIEKIRKCALSLGILAAPGVEVTQAMGMRE